MDDCLLTNAASERFASTTSSVRCARCMAAFPGRTVQAWVPAPLKATLPKRRVDRISSPQIAAARSRGVHVRADTAKHGAEANRKAWA